MERIYNTYLKIIKNICTSSDHSVSVHPEDLAALAKLAQLVAEEYEIEPAEILEDVRNVVLTLQKKGILL